MIRDRWRAREMLSKSSGNALLSRISSSAVGKQLADRPTAPILCLNDMNTTSLFNCSIDKLVKHS